ncbi:nucleotidyltransferase family protein [Mycoplasmatota bacterium]|nr:nucleotidyltransferase family protein [Mycoplasmatota bacterium]
MTDGIILAGGYSSRLGKNKMNVLFRNKPVILHTIAQMKAVCENVYLVTGFYHDEIKRLVKDLDDINVIYNANYAQGMFSSIKHGVMYVQNNFFIIPGDYPLVCSETYNKLKLGTKAIRVPSFSFKLGHPIYFDLSYKEKILKTKVNDLKSFRNQYDFEIINVNDSGILFDIDTLEDLKKLKMEE